VIHRSRTPLRYPGGKQRLAPFLAEVLAANKAGGWDYAEPYAGGAGIAMELLCDNKVENVHLNDSSAHVFSLWKSMLSDPDAFCSRISLSSLSIDEWRRHREVVRHPKDHSVDELGFSTFYLNRCNRSGILTAGVIGGFAQTGRWRIDARFPRNELIRRITVIGKLRKRITVTNLDAEVFMTETVKKLPQKTLVYCDPPYYERSEKLYLNSYKPEDHVRIARVIQTQLKRPWVVSYDGHPDILKLYSDRKTFCYGLQYSAIRAYEGQEMFAFSDRVNLPATSSLAAIARGLATRAA
jgi:DNA adenine methylase